MSLTDEELRRKSEELRERSRQLRVRSTQLTCKNEDVKKRAQAVLQANIYVRAKVDHILKKCGCGKHYTVHEWFELPFAGYTEHVAVSGEMRHCPCNSTLLFITRRSA